MRDNDFKTYISAAKKNRDPSARLIVPVTREDDTQIGSLACVDCGMAEDRQIVARMTKWRATFMTSFLTRFPASDSRTHAWLRDVVLPSPDRILFIILSEDSDPVGLIGLCNLTDRSAELDNVIRGERSGAAHLTYLSAVALLAWTFQRGMLLQIVLGVLSDNFPAINLYNKLGFSEFERHTLTAIKRGDTVSLVQDQADDGTEKYQFVRMRLMREEFKFRPEKLAQEGAR